MEENGGGDLVRTWHRLMCCALAEVMSLILEQQRSRRGTSSERMGDLVDIRTEGHR